ncbi:hypothetical protein M8494_00470 [Serratia ureilytica]
MRENNDAIALYHGEPRERSSWATVLTPFAATGGLLCASPGG